MNSKKARILVKKALIAFRYLLSSFGEVELLLLLFPCYLPVVFLFSHTLG